MDNIREGEKAICPKIIDGGIAQQSGGSGGGAEEQGLHVDVDLQEKKTSYIVQREGMDPGIRPKKSAAK